MKKKVLFVAALFIGATAFAQDGLTSKKGEAYLPEAGDWAIGFDGTPFLNYAGNMFNGTANNTVTAGWVGNTPAMTIYGKMFKDENTAYRAKVRIGFGSTSRNGVMDTTSTTTVGEFTDEMSTSNFNITLGGGIEKRRGNTRIQGIYGAEALLSFGSTSTDYTYADALDINHTATQFDFGTGNTDFNGTTGERVLSNSAGSTFSFGVRAFIGVEWFISPKVSVGAEYGWGLAFSSTGDGEVTTEKFEVVTGGTVASTVSRTHTTGGSSSFGIDTDNNGGAITIMFHF